MNEEFVGNLSTIIKVLVLTFVPAAFLEQVDANTLSVALTVIVMFVFSIIDAKYANTFKILKNDTQDIETTNDEEQISDEGI